MTHTLYEMPEQHFPCTSIYFYKMNHQHLLPIKTGHLELFFFNSGLPFIKWGLAEAFYSDKGSPFHKGMYKGYYISICANHSDQPTPFTGELGVRCVRKRGTIGPTVLHDPSRLPGWRVSFPKFMFIGRSEDIPKQMFMRLGNIITCIQSSTSLYIYIHCILIAYWLITIYYYYAYNYVHTRVQSLFIPYVYTLQSFDSPRVKPLMLGFSMALHSQQRGAFSFWFGGPKLVGSIWNFRTRPVGL